MPDIFQQIDVALFYFFNRQIANPLFDLVMPFVTNKYTWFPVWLAVLVLLSWKGGKRGRWSVLLALLAIALTEPLVNRLLKPLIERVRPCNALDNVHLLVRRSRGLSMPSSHAANFIALATVFSYFYRKYQIIFWSLAALVAYSRIAVGVHYPADVLFGAIVGYLCGKVWLLILKKRMETSITS